MIMTQNVFITKYALSSGIIQCEMEVEDDGKICCEKRRIKKIESLIKQIDKLNKITFTL